MRLDTRRISRIMFLLYIAAVGVLCLIKTDSLPKIPALWLGIPADKIAHFCMFMPFPALAYMPIMPRMKNLWTTFLTIAVLAAMGAAFAFGTEIMQGQTGYRSYDINDFYADMTGLAAGAVLTAAFVIINSRRRRK